jgi:hypothetical protein
MRLRPRHVRHTGLFVFAAVFIGGCTELGGMFGQGGEDPERARAQAETASVWELTLMAGRYGVMLDQARTILKLPEPTAMGPDFPAGSGEGLDERKALAAQQVSIAEEFYADAARACAKKRVPSKLRAMACAHRAGVPAALRQPAPLDVPALSARNEALDKFVMPWWDATCATVPKPRGEDAEPVCPME